MFGLHVPCISHVRCSLRERVTEEQSEQRTDRRSRNLVRPFFSRKATSGTMNKTNNANMQTIL